MTGYGSLALDEAVSLDNLPVSFRGGDFLMAAGLKGDLRKLEQTAASFGNDPLTLELLAAYLKRWYAGRLNGLETIPVLYDKQKSSPSPLRRVLAAFEQKLSGASDLTLLYLLSLSNIPVPQEHMKVVFRSTLLERWLTRRDEYVRFLGPLGRLNEDHWHWVIENLRRLKLLEAADSGQQDLLLVPARVREYFSSELKLRHHSVYIQARADMDKLFKETVVSLYERMPDRLEIRTYMPPDMQEKLAARDAAEREARKKPAPVLWKEDELDKARQQLDSLRSSLAAMRLHSEVLQDLLRASEGSLK